MVSIHNEYLRDCTGDPRQKGANVLGTPAVGCLIHPLQPRPWILLDGLEPPHERLPLLLSLDLVLGPSPHALSRVFGQRHVTRLRSLPCGDLELGEAAVDLQELRYLRQALLDRRVQLPGDGRLHDIPHYQTDALDFRADLGVAEGCSSRGVAAAFLRVFGVMVVASSFSGYGAGRAGRPVSLRARAGGPHDAPPPMGV